MPQPDVKELLRICLDDTTVDDPSPSLCQQYYILRKQLHSALESTRVFTYIPLQLNNHPNGDPIDMTKLFSKADDDNYITTVAILIHPFSREDIHISPSDPEALTRTAQNTCHIHWT